MGGAAPSWATFRSGRVPDSATGRRSRRGRGRGRNPARQTMDLGKLGHDAELGINDGAGAQARVGGFGAFVRALFSRGEDTRTRPVPRDGVAPAGMRFGHLSGGSGGLDRSAAASSLGSLQSYATSTIRGPSGPIPSCLAQSSTSEVGMRKRVFVKREVENLPVFSEEMRQRTLLSRRPERFVYPNFALAEYGGRETWASDVFVLPHNAIRWEIMDLYTILGSIQRRWSSLQMADIWDLSEYWEVFEVFVAQYFEIEDQIIFPFLLNVASDSMDLNRYHKVVKYNKDRLEAMLLDVGTTLELFNSAPAGDVLPKLYKQLSEYLPKLLDYMQQQEKVLPKVFSSFCEPEDRALINRAAANFIVRAANGREGIAILTRWIEDSMILQMWKNENLSPRAKSSHKKWISSLESKHVEIARRFQRRLRSLPKDEEQNSSGNSAPAGAVNNHGRLKRPSSSFTGNSGGRGGSLAGAF